jgi:hypothetical protein
MIWLLFAANDNGRSIHGWAAPKFIGVNFSRRLAQTFLQAVSELRA